MSKADDKQTLLEVKDLSVGYEGHPVAEHLNFTVKEGDYLCIVGENGSGKTTLMKTLLNLTKPVSGTINKSEALGIGGIGYLPQQTEVQRDFPCTVKEVVLSGCIMRAGRRPFFSREEKQLAETNMERMDILPLADRCYRELSGGQQQRVLLARALCATRKLLLLDEPVAGLDPKVTAELYRMIDSLHKDGITIIMVSHDIAAALQYATHILHVGNRMFFGTRGEYRSSKIGQLFLAQEGREG